MRKYKIRLDQFHFEFILLLGDTIADVIEYVNYLQDEYCLDGFDGFVVPIDGKLYCGISLDSDSEIVYHESLHLAYDMMRQKGIDFSQEEVMAYTQGYIAKQIFKKQNANSNNRQRSV